VTNLLRQVDVQGRRDLQIADGPLRRIAGEAHIVTHQAGQKAAVAQFRQRHPRTDDGQRVPFAAGEVRSAGGSDNADAAAGGPARVERLDEGCLKVGIA
jgi:hypothetical protein